MQSENKHSYIQAPKIIKPGIINRSVDLAREQETIDTADLNPPLNRLSSQQAEIPVQNLDCTKTPEGFGRWAIPKLKSNLHSECPQIVLAALLTLSDMVHDPEKGYEAIRLRVPDRLAELLLHEDPALRERVCMLLTSIAQLADGGGVIVKNKVTVKNIELLMKDCCEAIRHKNAILITTLSRVWFVADYLIEACFIPTILDLVVQEDPEIQAFYLEALSFLMYAEGKDQALELGAFDTFLTLIESDNNEVVSKAADCLMMITSTYSGKDLAYDCGILPRLTELLHHENSGIYASIASAIMFCTIKSRAKIRANEIPCLTERLVTLCSDWHNPKAQIYAIKALTNICEHPCIRYHVKEKHLACLEEIVVGCDEGLARHKDILLAIVKWLPWELD